MTFELAFLEPALREWKRLDRTVRDQFKSKLAERLENPRIPSAKLHGHPDRYKIKLRSAGYRLVYEVRDAEVIVLVVAVGRRERDAVYLAVMKR
ncbi:type II toxin-antitoxin system RelE family toxin [Burkholderia ubonensis]|uniref:type II toxin-antitoxin system RelE family toxin n=1 Tax=Burkholderia ubonensis TaxID=101571 RepID=UPI000BA5FC04|nr:type II toxin-antitoxin system RelE/ParE family toxin [Burkholderia ubonensis]PAK11359.1 addiction module antitoxin [Burkholderia ubonensis]RQP32263.1 type II toxin-antitoxin system RelE/ParE family toxin [Burkholderia ubonensis]RQP34776.1 type II toxin-antitoxin system RelE/ParE family toxin [Burkholderia ubonensis]RQP37903.1 type II toxin-antitoxin system RelE/ParE family toxin [Burkholderia ubonensis]RQP49719.1 type II toxin-antitoxin system RelE/ParE family toxin [Burkholderia ubonensis